MNKQEFAVLAKIKEEDINDEDYSVIEFVYARHPAIKSKQDIVNIWKLPNGMMIIRDMVETSKTYEMIEREMIHHMDLMNKAKNAMEALKLGRTQDVNFYIKNYIH